MRSRFHSARLNDHTSLLVEAQALIGGSISLTFIKSKREEPLPSVNERIERSSGISKSDRHHCVLINERPNRNRPTLFTLNRILISLIVGRTRTNPSLTSGKLTLSLLQQNPLLLFEIIPPRRQLTTVATISFPKLFILFLFPSLLSLSLLQQNFLLLSSSKLSLLVDN